MSRCNLFIPVKFAFLLVDLSKLHGRTLMSIFKNPVEIGDVIEAGQKGNTTDLFVRFDEQLTGVFNAHGNEVIGEWTVSCFFKKMTESRIPEIDFSRDIGHLEAAFFKMFHDILIRSM